MILLIYYALYNFNLIIFIILSDVTIIKCFYLLRYSLYYNDKK
jgi:hypothetical protein